MFYSLKIKYFKFRINFLMLPTCKTFTVICRARTQAPIFTQLYALPASYIKLYFVGITSDPKLKIGHFM